MKLFTSKLAAISCIAILGAGFSLPSYGQTFTGAVDNSYNNGANWTGGLVPDLTTGNTALINDGAAVIYTPGGDLLISNGGKLEIANGSWTQVTNNNYIQLGLGGAGGNGTILVDGGTFNQGSASSTPFAITGTGNLFNITSGAANFNTSVNINAGLSFVIAGGTVNAISGELDVNSGGGLMTGGVLNTRLLTIVNAGANIATASFQFSGGTINFSDSNGVYGANQDQINFTLGSTGTINFEATSAATVQNMINSGVIQYNNAVDTTDLIVTSTGANSATVTTMNMTATPEPSTWAMLFGGLVLVGFVVRRRANRA